MPEEIISIEKKNKNQIYTKNVPKRSSFYNIFQLSLTFTIQKESYTLLDLNILIFII